MTIIQPMTEEEANEMRRRAINRAMDLNIVDAIKYLIENDKNVSPGSHRFRPLHGAGYMIHYRRSGTSLSLSVANAYNETDRVFLCEVNGQNVTYRVFREGPWVSTLLGAVESLKWELDHKPIVKIISDFAPVDGYSPPPEEKDNEVPA